MPEVRTAKGFRVFSTEMDALVGAQISKSPCGRHSLCSFTFLHSDLEELHLGLASRVKGLSLVCTACHLSIRRLQLGRYRGPADLPERP